jgi:hypothetical protein
MAGVTVSIAGLPGSTRTDSDGRWSWRKPRPALRPRAGAIGQPDRYRAVLSDMEIMEIIGRPRDIEFMELMGQPRDMESMEIVGSRHPDSLIAPA